MNDIFKEYQVFTYQAPWLIYAMNFSTSPVLFFILAHALYRRDRFFFGGNLKPREHFAIKHLKTDL